MEMHVAGISAANGAVFLDLMLGFSLLQIAVGVLRALGLLSEGATPILIVVLTLVVLAIRSSYVGTEHRASAIGHLESTLSVSLIPEYSDKGVWWSLNLCQMPEYSRRAIIGAAALCVLVASGDLSCA